MSNHATEKGAGQKCPENGTLLPLPTAEKDADGYGFIETLFGFKADPMRVLAEQAVCTVCGKGGFHTHVLPPGAGA